MLFAENESGLLCLTANIGLSYGQLMRVRALIARMEAEPQEGLSND
jgi:hypothetical protein